MRKEGNFMLYNRIHVSLLSIFLILFLFCPVRAQFRKINQFKKVEVPFNLKYKGSTFKKGKFDFEIIVHRSLNIFQLRITKKGKSLCIVPGKILRDYIPGRHGDKFPDIPEDPTLKIQRIPAKKEVNIIFETGSQTEIFPCYKVRFKMEYE